MDADADADTIAKERFRRASPARERIEAMSHHMWGNYLAGTLPDQVAARDLAAVQQQYALKAANGGMDIDDHDDRNKRKAFVAAEQQQQLAQQQMMQQQQQVLHAPGVAPTAPDAKRLCS